MTNIWPFGGDVCMSISETLFCLAICYLDQSLLDEQCFSRGKGGTAFMFQKYCELTENTTLQSCCSGESYPSITINRTKSYPWNQINHCQVIIFFILNPDSLNIWAGETSLSSKETNSGVGFPPCSWQPRFNYKRVQNGEICGQQTTRHVGWTAQPSAFITPPPCN